MASPEITLTHLDEPLFDEADATKRDLVDYLEGHQPGGRYLPDGSSREPPSSRWRSLSGCCTA